MCKYSDKIQQTSIIRSMKYNGPGKKYMTYADVVPKIIYTTLLLHMTIMYLYVTQQQNKKKKTWIKHQSYFFENANLVLSNG